MQTFLPEATFEASASVLDYRRLGKQRVECLQLLNALSLGPKFQRPSDKRIVSTPWYNHPACKMWVGYEASLIEYGKVICLEWIRRGYKDTCLAKIGMFKKRFGSSCADPYWYTEDFRTSHKSNLIRKLPSHYGPIWPGVPSDIPYIWPIQ